MASTRPSSEVPATAPSGPSVRRRRLPIHARLRRPPQCHPLSDTSSSLPVFATRRRSRSLRYACTTRPGRRSAYSRRPTPGERSRIRGRRRRT
eukprot:6541766-Prymnesium_polylepis.1